MQELILTRSRLLSLTKSTMVGSSKTTSLGGGYGFRGLVSVEVRDLAVWLLAVLFKRSFKLRVYRA